MSNLDKQVLVLNRSWQPINVMTVQKALSMMAADAATAFDFCEDGYFARICYERAEPLCHSLNQSRLQCLALRGQWRYCLMTDKLSVAIQIAERGYSLAQEQNDAALKIGACAALAANLFYLGDFESARRYARHGVQIWRSGGVKFPPEEPPSPPPESR